MIGQTLAGFRIIEQIGTGGMATVFKAYDASADRYVAIKTLHQHYSTDPSFRTRFELEAKAIAKLEHIHILPMFAYGEVDGIAYMAMRYLETGTLKELMADDSLSLERISLLLKQIASALDYAHSQQIIHRDIKPSNILVDRQENAMLTDFGIAKIIESTLDLTGTGIIGTPEYMSPEQFKDSSRITPASDQYSLAVILYEMITGRTPYEAETPVAILQKQMLAEPLPLPRSLRPDLPEETERVILKALSREPDQRFASCMALADAFEHSLSQRDKRASQEYITIVPEKPKRLPDIQTEILKINVTTSPIYRNAFLIGGITLLVSAIIIGVWISSFGNSSKPEGGNKSISEIVTQTVSVTQTDSATDTLTATVKVTRTATATVTHSATQKASVTALATVSNITEDLEPALYDNFQNTLYEGKLNVLRWQGSEDRNCVAKQQAGIMNLSGTQCGIIIGMSQRGTQVLQADLMLLHDKSLDAASNLGVRLVLNQGTGGAVCGLGVESGVPRAYFYYTDHHDGRTAYEEAIMLEFEQWFTFKLKYNFQNSTFSCVVDDISLGAYTPVRNEKDLVMQILDSEVVASVDNVISNAVPGSGWVDIPSNNEMVSGITEVAGWVLIDTEIEHIDLFVDGEQVAQARYGLARDDIKRIYPDISDAHLAGFISQFDTRQYPNGSHIVEVWIITTDGKRILLTPGSVNIKIDN